MNTEIIFGWEIAESDQFVESLIEFGLIDDTHEFDLFEIADLLNEEIEIIIGGDRYEDDYIPYIGISIKDNGYNAFQSAYKYAKETLEVLERIFGEKPEFKSVVIMN